MIILVRPHIVELKILGRKKGLNTTQFSIYPDASDMGTMERSWGSKNREETDASKDTSEMQSSRLGKMTWLVQCLPHKLDGLSLNPHKNARCLGTCVIPALERWRQETLGAHYPVNPVGELQVNEWACLKGMTPKVTLWPPHAHTCIPQ